MHTPVCLCTISDHVPQTQSHHENLRARGWEVWKHTSFQLLLLLLLLCVCVCVNVRAHLCMHTCMLICPPCFSHSVQLCSMAQSCLGEQTTLIGLNGLDFPLHVQDSWHGVQSKIQGSGVPGFQSRLCCLLDVQTEANYPTSLSFSGLREKWYLLVGVIRSVRSNSTCQVLSIELTAS